jgi:GH25 family lysozyme M1 (1,4-beta-N-acetylmuramidase)
VPRRRSLTRALVSFAVAVGASGAALLTAGVGPADAVTGITGPDVSSYQHPHGVSINWAAVKRQNRVFAIVKATESGWYVNPWFGRDYSGAHKAGLVRGSYHFAVPKYPIVKTATSQAEFYLRRLGDTVRTTQTLPPALDLEVDGGLSRAALIQWAQTFLLTVRKESGRTPLLYTYPDFWFRTLGDAAALRRYPLWFANYHGTTIPGATQLWQFTSGGKVWGIRGGVDLSRFIASADEWAALSDGTVATPWEPAAPGAPIQVHASPGMRSATLSWLPGDAGTSGITGYQVVASPGGQVVNVGGLTTHATVTGLTNGTSYTFTVTATNAVGAGAPSVSNAVVPATPTALTISAPSSVASGAPIDVRGVLTSTDGSTPVSGAAVTVATRPHGGGAWTDVATLTTDDAGAVSTTVSATRSIDVRMSYAGAPGLLPTSTVTTVLVRRAVAAQLSTNRTRVRHAVTLSGSVTPSAGGVTVVRQGFFDGAWHTWAVTHTGAAGRFSFRIVPTVRTVDIYRVVVRTSDGRTLGVSKVMRLRVV